MRGRVGCARRTRRVGVARGRDEGLGRFGQCDQYSCVASDPPRYGERTEADLRAFEARELEWSAKTAEQKCAALLGGSTPWPHALFKMEV